MKEERIVVAFFKVPLKVKYEALADVMDEKALVGDALMQYLQEFPSDVEIWKVEKNIAVTELGYIIAMEQTPQIEELINEREMRDASR